MAYIYIKIKPKMSQSLKNTFARNTNIVSEKDKSKKNLSRNRGYWYSFTINNPNPDTLDLLSQGKFGKLPIDKLVCQEECGEEKGTLHIQGTVKFKNQVEFNSVRKNMPKAHIEKTRNIMASMNYCSKIDTKVGKVITYGNVSKLLPKEKKRKMNETEICRFVRDSLREDGINIPVRYARNLSSPP